MFVGVDVGTQGVRAVACTDSGQIVAASSDDFDSSCLEVNLVTGFVEQDARNWWQSVSRCLLGLTASVRDQGFSAQDIRAIAVDSTSGTILAVDASGELLHPAIMYNDGRAQHEADECNQTSGAYLQKMGYRFSSAFGLPKILWLKNHTPEVFDRTAFFVHAADYIIGQFTGSFGVSDVANMLKTGYDSIDRKWPAFIEDDLGIPISKLPRALETQEVAGVVSANASITTGIPAGTPVATGTTDGVAGFLASGAARPGDWNTTIGTTLVLKGISEQRITDDAGRVYCHVHPDGWWLPGGASNTGAECISKLYATQDLQMLGRKAAGLCPTSIITYPLMRPGERFPFVHAGARGFIQGFPTSQEQLYASLLEGVGYVERWSLELFEQLGAPIVNTVYTTGGGA
ncbi:MAG: FGGY family carbohydrate kinase, partial [Armatimonadetes bacterium]|nr:FGGY family carbohydrate kinase [Armatimonadota bacterium]